MAFSGINDQRMGQVCTMALHKLGENTLGVKLVGPRISIVQCQHCSLAKIKRPESRRSPLRDRSIPGMEIHVDWTDIEESHEGFARAMFTVSPTPLPDMQRPTS
jgi:hypothetical protein